VFSIIISKVSSLSLSLVHVGHDCFTIIEGNNSVYLGPIYAYLFIFGISSSRIGMDEYCTGWGHH